MRPVLFQIGESFKAYGYGFCIAVGIILCVAFAYYRAKKKYAIDPDMLFNAAIIGIVAGFIGGKLLYWIVEIKTIIANPHFMLESLTGGFVVYGGLVLGILAPVVYLKWIKKVTVLEKVDLAVASIAMAQGIGRIGCFLAGCCFGREIPAGAWYSFIGVTFPAHPLCEAPAGVALIPTQLISAGGDLLLFLFLWWYTKRERFAGENTCLYIGLYAIGRFLVEMLRGDKIRGFAGALSTSQWISIGMLVLAVVLYFVFRKMGGAPLRVVGPYVEEGKKTTDK